MGSNIRQCIHCRKLFQSLGSNVCPECAEEMDRQFNIVKDYIYNHPSATVVDIAKDTQIPEKTILNFLREGRLSLSDLEYALECEKCGAPISHGRFCITCQNQLENMLGSACKPDKKNEGMGRAPGMAKMHTSFGRK